jgi:hypothetical protein
MVLPAGPGVLRKLSKGVYAGAAIEPAPDWIRVLRHWLRKMRVSDVRLRHLIIPGSLTEANMAFCTKLLEGFRHDAVEHNSPMQSVAKAN